MPSLLMCNVLQSRHYILIFIISQNWYLAVSQNQVLDTYWSNLIKCFFHHICILTFSFLIKESLCQLLEQYESKVTRWRRCLFGGYREEREIILHFEIILHLRFFSKGRYDLRFFVFKHTMNW